MMMMQMYFYQSCRCIFLFSQLESNEGECGTYFSYLALMLAFCLLVDSIPVIKSKVVKSSGTGSPSRKALLVLLQLGWLIGTAMTMLLLMSYNWLVILVVCASKAVFYGGWGLESEVAMGLPANNEERTAFASCH